MSSLPESAPVAALHPARFFTREPDGKLLCTLCPRDCRLGDGQAGFCFVRQNVGGRMVSLAYGRSTGFAADPVEKKPLNHFHPGSHVLSFGTVGCNLGCRFCQNWDISKARVGEREMGIYTPSEVVELAVRAGCPSVAFTYNDPIIWAEWAIDVAEEAHRRGLSTVAVTNGYIRAGAREEFFAHMDAANVDLKGFTEAFYARLTLSHLAPVLETLEWLARDGKVWTEVTNLVIPGHNDDPAETRRLAEWIRDHMGAEVPVHFTAFHPAWKMSEVSRTPTRTLVEARRIARSVGLRHVYTGNVHDPEGQVTRCTRCGARLVERDGFEVRVRRLGPGGTCLDCGTRLAGRF